VNQGTSVDSDIVAARISSAGVLLDPGPRRLVPATYYKRGGFHHARAPFLTEWIRPAGSEDFQPEDPAAPRLPDDRTRYTAKAEYEWIFLAVNDQPLSLVVDGRAQSRNDVPDLPTKWHFQGTASVRFSLWAPPRRDAPAQEKL
jgi:hypothetical protein